MTPDRVALAQSVADEVLEALAVRVADCAGLPAAPLMPLVGWSAPVAAVVRALLEAERAGGVDPAALRLLLVPAVAELFDLVIHGLDALAAPPPES